VNRFDLQELANIRIREAETLLHASLFDGAYYLAGYAVECALKACIAKQTREFDFPDRAVVNDSYTHDLDKLVRVAGLDAERQDRSRVSKQFEINWALVKDWSEGSRYDLNDEQKARDFVRAVADRRTGVLGWLKGHW
jgi:HEPN domain-containing protein